MQCVAPGVRGGVFFFALLAECCVFGCDVDPLQDGCVLRWLCAVLLFCFPS